MCPISAVCKQCRHILSVQSIQVFSIVQKNHLSYWLSTSKELIGSLAFWRQQNHVPPKDCPRDRHVPCEYSLSAECRGRQNPLLVMLPVVFSADSPSCSFRSVWLVGQLQHSPERSFQTLWPNFHYEFHVSKQAFKIPKSLCFHKFFKRLPPLLEECW